MRADRMMINSFVARRRKRRALLAAAVSAMALLGTLELTVSPSAWAIAARSGEDMFGNLQTVSDEKLAQERGKFSFGALNMNIGAMVSTLVNGQLALQSNFNSPDGMNFKLTGPPVGFLTGNPGPANAPLALGDPPGNGAPGDPPGNGAPKVIVNGVNLPNGQIVTLPDPNNANLKTVATSLVSPAGAQNLITGNGNNHSLTQNIQFVVTMNNFSQFQQQLIAAGVANNVLNAVRAAQGIK